MYISLIHKDYNCDNSIYFMKFIDWHDNEHELAKGKTYSWRPSAYALIKKGTSILMIKTSHGTWELPGGGVELYEGIQDGLTREVREETGYDIRVSQQIPLFFGDSYFFALDIKQYYHALLFVFAAELVTTVQKERSENIGEEITDVQWVDIKKITDYKLNKIAEKVIAQVLPE
jgi:8-oxo-dGTP pyrophosphatase MutT (NUDIX family)